MKQLLLIFLTLLLAAVVSAQEKQEQSHHSFFHMDVFDYKYYFCKECDFPNGTHNLTLNLLGGMSKNEYGLVVGTLLNRIENNAYGIQIAGLYNHVESQGKGLAIVGGINYYKSHSGVQIGAFNHAKKMRGLQIGISNNTIDMQGVQMGFINDCDTSQTLKGAQVGVVNMGKSRLQIGLCNISENNQYPVGFINIIKNGEMSVGLTYDEIGSVIAQFRSGSRYLYGIIGLGVNTQTSNNHLALQAGLGAHLTFSARFRIDMEVSASHLSRTFMYIGGDGKKLDERKREFDFRTLAKYSVGLYPSLKLTNKIELFAGPTLNYLQTKRLKNKRLFPSHYIWKDFNSNSLKQLYIGYSIGVKYILNSGE